MNEPSRSDVRTRTVGFFKTKIVASQDDESPVMPWWIAATGGGIVAAVSSLLVILALVTTLWFTAPDQSYLSITAAGVGLWLLAHGAPLQIGDLTIGIVPLGFTVFCAVLIAGTCGYACRQWILTNAAGPREIGQRERRKGVANIVVLVATSYSFCVVIIASFVNSSGAIARAWAGALVLAGLVAAITATKGLQWRPLAAAPQWVQAIPRAMGLAAITMVVFSLAVLITAIVRYYDRITAIQSGLDVSGWSAVLLVILQLLWLPNLLAWCSSWALGAGIQFGTATVASPSFNSVGLLPAIPILGIIPPNGVGPQVAFWWLSSGLLAGGLAAWYVIRRLPSTSRVVVTVLIATGTGILAGTLWWFIAMTSSGDLGTQRLVAIGPRPLPLAVMSISLMGIAGLVTGTSMALWRLYRERGRAGSETTPTVSEPAANANADTSDDESSTVECDSATTTSSKKTGKRRTSHKAKSALTSDAGPAGA